jgi:hypothetical protein
MNHERNQADTLLMAGLKAWHVYSTGRVQKMEPVGVHQLARIVGVSGASATKFFKRHFGARGWLVYHGTCLEGTIGAAIAKITREAAAGPRPSCESMARGEGF